MARHFKYNWAAIKEQYVQADPPIGLRQLADATGISYPAISDHSRHDGWAQARLDYQNAAMLKARSLAIDQKAHQAVNSIDALDLSVDILHKQLLQMSAGLAGKDWSEEDPDKIARASSSVANALDKVSRCRELLTGGADSRQQIDLATVLAVMNQGKDRSPE